MTDHLELLVERWEDQRTVKNLMGKYVNCLLLNRQGEIFDSFFSKKEDVCLTFNDGSYVGPEAVKGYFDAVVARNKLSAKLLNLSQQWGAADADKYFDYLKGETLAVLKDVSGSLLNDERTQMLIPLITHNLSRYNNSPYMCKEYFNLLLSQISSGTLRESLKNSFARLYSAIFSKQKMNDPQQAEQAQNIPTDNYTTKSQQNQPLTGNSADKNAEISSREEKISQVDENGGSEIVENAENEEPELSGYLKFLNQSMGEKGYMSRLKDSGYNIEQMMTAYSRGRQSGFQTLHDMVKGLFADDKTGEYATQFTQDFSKLHTVQEVIDKLNEMLRAMPDIPIRERLYGAFVEVIDKMALKNELPQHGVRPPVSSTLDSLTDFIQENINHPALKSLDSFNAANLLQSLLNAPGVFTPLAHYILPLDVDGTKAFGELWVDNDENNPNNTPGTQRNYHLFLTFDVESIGRFEVDLYALGDEVNLALLYPPRFEKQIEPMKDRINKVVRNVGYNTRSFETAPLKTPHNLTEIFPKIVDKRTTLNTRV